MKSILRPLKKPDTQPVTRENHNDYTEPGTAPDRVLRINLGFFRYGTNDKTHGAAVILSILILVFMLFVFSIGAYFDGARDLSGEFLQWLGGAFLFIAGVAVGKGSNGKDG